MIHLDLNTSAFGKKGGKLLQREAFWKYQLQTEHPGGLNVADRHLQSRMCSSLCHKAS